MRISASLDGLIHNSFLVNECKYCIVPWLIMTAYTCMMESRGGKWTVENLFTTHSLNDAKHVLVGRPGGVVR